MEREISAAPERGREGQQSAATQVTTNVAYLRDRIVNLFFVGEAGAGEQGWTLVDAGLYGSAERVVRAAEDRFGPGARPAAIVLTHGHFDHVGALETLAERWDVPVYAHELELPYLTGRAAYPPPDPTVGGGAMAFMSRTFPRGPIDLGSRVRTLPADGAVPGMPGLRWLHTPGHSPGHVSLVRDTDRTVIAGDAVITTKQESTLSVLLQRPEVRRPPAYATTDWQLARISVESIAALQPELLATGHGVPMRGPEMRQQLETLAREFARIGIPEHGRYVWQPATAGEDGPIAVPPAVPTPE